MREEGFTVPHCDMKGVILLIAVFFRSARNGFIVDILKLWRELAGGDGGLSSTNSNSRVKYYNSHKYN